MAHFARIQDGVVLEVIVVTNDNAATESEGQRFITTLGLDGEWIQTSYNGNPIEGQDRGPFAGIGYTWDGQQFHAPLGEPVTPAL